MYKIKFFHIPELYSKEWLLSPPLPIEYILFTLPTGKVLRLEGFESYLILTENYKFPFHKQKKDIIDTINVLAKWRSTIIQLSYNVPRKFFAQTKNEWGMEFTPLIWNPALKKWDKGKGRKTNRSLWKQGIPTIPKLTPLN